MLLGWLMATALASTPSALVVVSPGMERMAFQPLIDELVASSIDVRILRFGCDLPGVDAHLSRLDEVVRAGAEDEVLVAHGYGATLLLLGAEHLPTRRLVLLAPVVGPVQGPLVDHLSALPIGLSLDLGEALLWREMDAWALMVGGSHRGRCVSAEAAREAQAWLRTGPPLHLLQVSSPVWLGVGAGDEVSPLEVVVPMTRALPARTLVRFGINRFDAADFSHGELLESPQVLRAVRQAVARP